MRRSLIVAALLAASAGAAAQGLVVHAAGSLRGALTELAQAFEARTGGVPVRLVFGPSGLLKDRLAGGEASQVFASANMTHPQALADAGRAEAVQPFARNALCGLATPAFSLAGKPLAQRLLDADVRVATSTPRADPAGDYAFQMFERIEAAGAAGAAAVLKGKALQLTGGPNSPAPVPGRSLYGTLMASGAADVFITYCTNAAEARREQPGLQVLEVPSAVNVAASYGIALVKPATPAARDFVAFVLAPAGQAILAAHGFSTP